MASLPSTATNANLNVVPVQENRRERKTLRTRREIVRAAAELVMEDGYERATIARIAERADLATRTITTRFPSKEAIFFEGFEVVMVPLQRHLQGTDGNVVDRLQAWIDEMSALEEVEDPEMRLLRSRAIARDPDLRALRVHHFNRAHDAIEAPCPLAADCGGCKTQSLAYAAQIRHKLVTTLRWPISSWRYGQSCAHLPCGRRR